MHTLKDLPKILKEFKQNGRVVEKFKGYINNRKSYYIDGVLYTDYEIIRNYGYL